MAKKVHEYTDQEYYEYGDDVWPWCEGVDDEGDDVSDYFPYWIPDPTKNKWNKKLLTLFPKYENYTPDMPELSLNRYHYVFVYGTLKRGCSNQRLMLNAVYAGKAWTKVRCLKMYKTKGNIPIVFFTSQSDGHAVQGEVYLCTPEQIRNLDNLEANGFFYKRRKILVQDDLGKEYLSFMYFGLKSIYNEDTLTLCNKFTRKKTNTDYFSYTPNFHGADNEMSNL